MQQDKFLQELLKRADEQHIVLHDVPFPQFFLFVSKKLGENPWRFFIVFSIILTIILHTIFLRRFDSMILQVFGGL